MKSKPKVIVFSGYGLNCEEETQHVFEVSGADADIVHINDVIEKPSLLSRYKILAMPGGFSYGDDTGSGRAYANKIKNHLAQEIKGFVEDDKLVIGICNGFQILTQIDLLPGALLHNDSNRYIDRWVDVRVEQTSPWLAGITELSLPVAHGEGKYYLPEKELIKARKEGSIALTYFKGEMCEYQGLDANPNGSLEGIAGVTAYDGRVFGLMPHPERAFFFTQQPSWTNTKEDLIREGKKVPKFGPSKKMFVNAVSYFTA